jgi:hypothetical protein
VGRREGCRAQRCGGSSRADQHGCIRAGRNNRRAAGTNRRAGTTAGQAAGASSGRPATAPPERPAQAVSARKAFALGAAIDLLNPKTGLFYVAVLPQVIPHDVPVLRSTLLFAGVDSLVAASLFTGVACAAAALIGWLRRPGFVRGLERTTGLSMVGSASARPSSGPDPGLTMGRGRAPSAGQGRGGQRGTTGAAVARPVLVLTAGLGAAGWHRVSRQVTTDQRHVLS